ncbi:hypothetical protein ONS95_013231 [Cadophora gregata]|uniref:uncharacterized protein n=1 Tax=Cadophora gregata TaxID=51156 RepID=UPI0026DAA038|nr:uncharacterized protein ONS95_013231 [Cadophora gregata]KAK0099947.1 hypothetical protein ONS96_007892 [Cadophora gregata f. sp. sojae]KAK0116201.1 hypothetical protein ONS95_013231 [Cadophora gregata]
MSTTRRKGATPKKAHKIEVSFTNWVMGGSLLSLSTTPSLGSRVASKGSHKSFDADTDDEEPPEPVPAKVTKKKRDVPPSELKKPGEVEVVCTDCQPQAEESTTKCALDCPVCNEECAWEKHMHEKYGGMECNTCGRGANWLMDEFHKGRGEYACEKCTPDCAACGRGPLWLSKKWEKTLKRRARKLQGVEKEKKDKRDEDGKEDKEDESTKKRNGDDGKMTKDMGKQKTNGKEKSKQNEKDEGANKEKDEAEDKSVEKESVSTSKNNESAKRNQDGKNKNTHDWTSEEDTKLKDLKAQNKSWKDIASELGINTGLCKARCKILEHSRDSAHEKKANSLSGNKQNTSGAEGDGFLGGFGDWNNDDSNNSGNTDNQGWGAADTSNTNGENSGNVDNGWGTNNNSNSNKDGKTSSWDNNNSSATAGASGGENINSSWESNNISTGDTGNQGWADAANSSWDNSNNNTTGHSGTQGWGDVGNSVWGNDDANKTSNDTSGQKENQQNQNKNDNAWKKQKNKNRASKEDKQNVIFAPITESNPTGYIPYKSANTAADETNSWDPNGTYSFTDATTAQASGGLNTKTPGTGWDAPKTDWITIDPSNGNAGNEPARDPWAEPESQKVPDNRTTSVSGKNPSTSAPAGDGWIPVTESNLDMPTNNNAGPSWSQLQNDSGRDFWNTAGNEGQESGDGGNSWGQGNNNSNNTESWTKPYNGNQQGGGSGCQGNKSSNNTGNTWNHCNNTNQNFGNGGYSWGQGNHSNNGRDPSNGPNEGNNSNPYNFNNGNNGRGFNSNNNSNGFKQDSRSRGKLHPNSVWTPQDCMILEVLELKYSDHKWKQMQADFYNSTGRMIPSELIEQKFRADGYV